MSAPDFLFAIIDRSMRSIPIGGIWSSISSARDRLNFQREEDQMFSAVMGKLGDDAPQFAGDCEQRERAIIAAEIIGHLVSVTFASVIGILYLYPSVKWLHFFIGVWVLNYLVDWLFGFFCGLVWDHKNSSKVDRVLDRMLSPVANNREESTDITEE